MRVATRMDFPPVRGWRRKGLGESADAQDDNPGLVSSNPYTYVGTGGIQSEVQAGMTSTGSGQSSTAANQIAAINAAAAIAAQNLAAASAAANAALAAHQATILPVAPQGNPVTAQVAQQAQTTQAQAAQALANLTGQPVPLPDGSSVVPDGSTAVGSIIYGSDGNYVPAGPASIGMPPVLLIGAALAAFLLLK